MVKPDSPAHLSIHSIIFGGWVLVLLAAALGLFTSRRISQPLQEMRRGAERFAAGDFSHRLTVPDTVELGSLAMTLNRMAAQLAEQIAVTTQQHNAQEAILESMHEGVLALDTQERVITVNRAAEILLGVVATQAKGHTIQEVVRNVALQRLLVAAVHSPEPTTADIVLRGTGERFLQATATALRDAQGRGDWGPGRAERRDATAPPGKHSTRLCVQRIARTENAHHEHQRLRRDAA